MTGYSSSSLERALAIYGGAPFDLGAGPIGPGETERCVEVPYAATVLRSAQSVLDIGYSMSHPDYLGLLMAYKASGAGLIGADIIRPERVASRYPEAWREDVLSTDVRIGDVRTMDLPSGAFDTVMCISTLEHIGFDAPSDSKETAFDRPKSADNLPERSQSADADALAAFHRALKTGGRLCLTVPAGQGGPCHIKDSTGHWAAYLEYGRSDWQRIRDIDGFEIVEEIGVVSTDKGWVKTDPFEKVYEASVDDKGLPRGCILAILRAR